MSAAEWIVLKFGGTSVSTKERWTTIGELAQERLDDGGCVLVVVSAVSGVTDQLKALIEAEPELRRVLAEKLIEKHRDFAEQLGVAHAVIAPVEAALRAALESPHGAARSFAWQAEIFALGELWSSRLGAAFLSASAVAAGWLDARTQLSAQAAPNQGNWARHLSTTCMVQHSPAVATGLKQGGRLQITQGFIARNLAGETVLLGRGGSDTSAACFGVLLGAQRVEIWTDVPGMFSANPRRVPEARLLRHLDYDEAQEIATTGAKVLHPRCLGPVRVGGVPLWIKDTTRPQLEGTRIDASGGDGPLSVKAISHRVGVTLVSMESIRMWQQVGFLADVFGYFRKHALSVDLIGTAATNVTVSLDPSENLISDDNLEALCADLARVCRVKVIGPCAAITLVGRGMRRMLHRLSEVLAEFGEQRVHMVSQSSNNLNLTFVVDEEIAESLLPRLHEHLIRARVMAVDDPRLFGPSWESLEQREVIAAATPWWHDARAQLLSIAEQQGPAYAYHVASVRAQAAQLLSVQPVDRWFYAIKANDHPQLLQALVDMGFGLECVSADELLHIQQHCPQLGAERIMFTPNFAPRLEYQQALAAGVMVTVDALHALQQWPEDFAGAQIALRVDLGPGRGHHDKVRTGGQASKFGLAPAELDKAQAAARVAGARIVGLHAHLGSGILDPNHWAEVYAQLAALGERFTDLRWLDIGGGLGVPGAGERPLDLAQVAAGLDRVKQLYPNWALHMEPGRFLVADAGVLLAKVTQVKEKHGVRFVGISAGMNALLRPALYDAVHPIVNLSRLHEPATETVTIVGPICESGDVLGRERRLPACVEGDVILIAQAGAYGAVMANRYNRRPLVNEVLL